MRVLAVAHRAANALPDLHAAVELGADVLEADVHHWRGRLEIRHAKALGPLPWHYDAGALTPISASQLLLQELLDALHQSSTLMLDLKGPGSGDCTKHRHCKWMLPTLFAAPLSCITAKATW